MRRRDRVIIAAAILMVAGAIGVDIVRSSGGVGSDVDSDRCREVSYQAAQARRPAVEFDSWYYNADNAKTPSALREADAAVEAWRNVVLADPECFTEDEYDSAERSGSG